ncbi:MAG: DUF2127 domain-containing protein [Chlorobiaceae bacterium]|nr:DUF2127 domain-containing protein [Chlorobiaceae bacterium]
MNTTTGGLRAIAMLETAKGLLVVAILLSLLALFHGGAAVTPGQLVGQLPSGLAAHFPKVFAFIASGITAGQFHLLAMLAALYSAMRFIEAYGLWYARTWAEWFALVSCSVYLPIEFYELAKGFSWIKVGFLSLNLVIVLYVAYVLIKKRSARRLIKEGGA